ncbi:CBN-SPTL-2 protein [Caenorhabditis brenneri]|uniref:serine C-palmitoyltransferase n=1 Tax=Caenorhabditis brenneri TaxID=135651 RepID=G0NIY6_CAEBE|nr:CBN-SPTL-2 protein [Caenorhabditis brenneri]
MTAEVASRSSAFRFLHKLPIRLTFTEKKSPLLISDLAKENDELKKRTHILECAWNQEHDDEEEEEEVTENGVGDGEEETDSNHDIYGDIGNRAPNEFEKIGRFTTFKVYIAWLALFVFAHIREYVTRFGFVKDLSSKENKKLKDFVPLFSDFEAFYQRNCYIKVRDVFERPICSVPGATVDLVDRVSHDGNWTYEYPGTRTNVINVGSYNYLGFAQSAGPCADQSAASIDKEGLSCCTTVHERGRSVSQAKLEKLVAEFLGVDDAICFSMGFATNSMNAPCLVDKHSLIISDKYNHASLILGCRLSGASTKVFEHNDMESLEKILRDAIAYGNPKTHRPYKKILIIVEGIYSMEGSICNLPGIIALKKKYKAYLYLDEAHSIGAMGKTGKGVVEYWGCDPKDVDILMGTFTKSFGAAGGYIAGSKRTVDHLRVASPTGYYSSPMSPPIAQQIYTSMSIIMGRDGTNDGAQRIERLARNSHYFRMKLKQMGFIVYGSNDSPVVPMLIYFPTMCGFYGRQMLERSIGCVVVSFPATHMTEGRVRFCISAAHTKEQLDYVLATVDELGSMSRSKFSRRSHLYKNQKIEW